MHLKISWRLRGWRVQEAPKILIFEFPEITEMTTIVLQELLQEREEDVLVLDVERIACEEISTLLTINLGHRTEPEDFDYLNECEYYPLCESLLENILRSKFWRAVGKRKIERVIVEDSYGTVSVQLSEEEKSCRRTTF